MLEEIKAIPGIARIDLSASFTDPDPGDSHEAVVDWGDGTFSNLRPATSPIRLCHTYAAPGVYSLRIVVTDSFGLEASSRGEFVAGVPAAYGTSEPCSPGQGEDDAARCDPLTGSKLLMRNWLHRGPFVCADVRACLTMGQCSRRSPKRRFAPCV